jgi:hypothetical protein
MKITPYNPVLSDLRKEIIKHTSVARIVQRREGGFDRSSILTLLIILREKSRY